ncbi:hypothetical protein [Pseudophaeobacter flagellatus]|uniref:hypothetical protein n=1 Tax=Pseudophaeobacter flagellatus TaxID=2899119 RepID=UPI001E355B0B|nr:hypothetical protein [Pseudophaeobacter flagellatus]MCD9148705.1 hypothetical protein [Pseudophaeobacter flagellatus]
MDIGNSGDFLPSLSPLTKRRGCMRARVLILGLCLTVVQPLAATAGAWKRPKGEGFVATSLILRDTEQGLEPELSYYRDFGVTGQFDLGIDLDQSDIQSGHALLFARLPLRQGDGGTQIAAELALGANHAQGLWHPMYRFTLSAGRGAKTRLGNLWGNLDLMLEQRGNAAHPLWKLDGSFGMSTGQRLSPLLSFETAFGQNVDFRYSITPAVRINLAGLSVWGKQPFETSDLTIGLEYRRSPRQSLGLKIALWQRF